MNMKLTLGKDHTCDECVKSSQEMKAKRQKKADKYKAYTLLHEQGVIYCS